MKGLSKREAVMLAVLFAVLTLAGYYNFFLKEYIEKNDLVTAQIAEAKTEISDSKVVQSAIILIDKKIEELTKSIGEYSNELLPGLDRPEIIRILDTAAYPYLSGSTVTFDLSQKEMGTNSIYTVVISFKTTKDNFMTILENLRDANLVNRVITSSLSIDNAETDECSAMILLEVLTGKNPTGSFKTD
ncbi:MAG: hypothetical protein PHX37_01390 [Eubacteriales bacterium]|nr:hypothetical protein [Eubacteriales bacterium]